MVYFILDALNKAANAVIANSQDAGRQLLAAQQTLEACRRANNPGLPGNTWIQGMRIQNAQWQPDPCQTEQEQVDQLMEADLGGGGDKVATMQQGGAPAPQLAHPMDPTPNMDPAIADNEFTVQNPGAHNRWLNLEPHEIVNMIIDQWEAEGNMPDTEMIDDILTQMRVVHMWCPWGGPWVTNLKWTFKYHPKNSDWIGKWLP